MAQKVYPSFEHFWKKTQNCRNPVNKCTIVSLGPLASTMDALYLPGYRKGCGAKLFVLQTLRDLPFAVQREWRDSRHIIKCINWKLLQKMQLHSDESLPKAPKQY